MKSRHLEKSDSGYKVYLYIFYICGFIMASSLIFGVYVTMIEWASSHVLSLPIHPKVTQKNIEFIAKTIRDTL